jgi:hypothetical protein
MNVRQINRYSVQELISTEKTYVYNLRVVVESIMKPLLELAANPLKPTIVKAKTVKKVFRNIDMILGFNENLLLTLTTTKAVENKVGKLFCKFAPFFKMCVTTRKPKQTMEVRVYAVIDGWVAGE